METGRFYERTVPEVGELVMVRIESIDDVGISCRLLEYNGLPARLPMSEVSKKRLRSIRKVVNVGQLKVLEVLRVEGGTYVDVGKKQVDREAQEEGTDKYEKGKHVISMVRQLAEVTHRSFDELCQEILWPLYTKQQHPYYSLQQFTFDGAELPEIPEELRDPLRKIVRQRIVLKQVKVGTTIELTCYTSEGIEAIKAAVASMKREFPQVAIQYQSAPTYQIWALGWEAAPLIQLIEAAVRHLTEEMVKRGGDCQMTTGPAEE